MVLTTTYGMSYGTELDDMVSETAGVVAEDYSEYPFMEAAYKVMADQQRNWNMLTESIATMELAYLKEHGVDIVYEEDEIVNTDSNKPSFVNKGVSIVRSWFSKILGLIRNWITNVEAKIAGQLFAGVPKNEKIPDNLKWPEGKSLTVKDYFSAYDAISDVNPIAATASSTKNGTMAGSNSAGSNALTMAVHRVSGKNDTKCSLKEINAYLLKDMTITGSNDKYGFTKCMSILKEYKSDISKAKELQSKAKRAADDTIKELKSEAKAQKKANNNTNDKAQNINAFMQQISMVLAFNTNLITARLSIAIGRLKLAKTIVMAYVNSDKIANRIENDKNKAAEKDRKRKEKEDAKNPASAQSDQGTAAAKNESSLATALDFELV